MSLFKNKIKILIIFFTNMIFFSSFAEEQNYTIDNYMMHKYKMSDPFYCKIKDPVEELACMAWDAALGSMMYFKKDLFDQELFKLLVSISAMNLIQQKVSGLRNKVYLEKNFENYNQNLCLVQKRGSCGNHQIIFQEIMDFVNIKSRKISLYMELNGKRLSHAMNEIKVYNKWVLLDTTNSAIYLNTQSYSEPQSFEDLKKHSEKNRFKMRRYNSTDTLALSQNESFLNFNKSKQDMKKIEQFAYLFDKTNITAILYDGIGIVNVNLAAIKIFDQLPNYLGTNTGKDTGIIMKLFSPLKKSKLKVNLVVGGIGGCNSKSPTILDDYGNEYKVSKGNNYLKIKNGVTLSIKKKIDEICYVIFNDINLIN